MTVMIAATAMCHFHHATFQRRTARMTAARLLRVGHRGRCRFSARAHRLSAELLRQIAHVVNLHLCNEEVSLVLKMRKLISQISESDKFLMERKPHQQNS
jgi:hypothetical protein